MSEPLHTATACGIAYASCYAIGADPSALILSLISAVATTMYMDEINNLRRTYGAVALSTLIGGYGAPATLAIVDIWLKRKGHAIPLQTLEFLAPIIVSSLVVVILPYVSKIVPTLVNWWLSKWGSKS